VDKYCLPNAKMRRVVKHTQNELLNFQELLLTFDGQRLTVCK